MNDALLRFDGDTWRIQSTGAVSNGRVRCHLVSTAQTRLVRCGRLGTRRVPRRCTVPLDAEAVAAALGRPSGWFAWSPALRGAFAKGEAAARDGGTEADCPYADKRTDAGHLT